MSKVDHSLIQLRNHLWSTHPVAIEKATIPTPTILRAYALVHRATCRHRDSLAFWAHPGTGKSSCITAMSTFLDRDFSGPAVVIYEAKKRSVVAEGPFLEDMLHEINFQPKISRSLAGKRDQVKRALYSMACVSDRLVLFIDEAQELHSSELCWLKCLINWFHKKITFVTIVLFGQHELISKRAAIMNHGRSDLALRFTRSMYEFENVLTAVELKLILKIYDEGSEFPEGTGISYTQFLLPMAFANGFRLNDQSKLLWKAFMEMSPATRMKHGVSMFWVARVLAEMAEIARDEDAPSFSISEARWREMIKSSGYVDATPAVL